MKGEDRKRRKHRGRGARKNQREAEESPELSESKEEEKAEEVPGKKEPEEVSQPLVLKLASKRKAQVASPEPKAATPRSSGSVKKELAENREVKEDLAEAVQEEPADSEYSYYSSSDSSGGALEEQAEVEFDYFLIDSSV